MPDPNRRLAILIAAPWRGETAMHSDLCGIYDALAARRLSAEELLVLEGRLDRSLLLGFLESVHSRQADWSQGDLFFYYSGHGAYAPVDAVDATDADPALVFAEEELEDPARWVFWHEIFTALSPQPGVHLTVLPDC